MTSDTLVNVNDTISGAGSISVSVFDNQAGGNVVASQVRGSALQISSATFTNEGQMVAGTTAALDFGTDGQSGSLTNTGTVRLEENADLAISGKFTISGSGTVENLETMEPIFPATSTGQRHSPMKATSTIRVRGKSATRA